MNSPLHYTFHIILNKLVHISIRWIYISRHYNYKTKNRRTQIEGRCRKIQIWSRDRQIQIRAGVRARTGGWEKQNPLQTVNSMQYSPSWSPSVPIADTPVCNIIDDSIQDIPPVPIVDTPACKSNKSSIQDIASPLSDTVSPQQTPGTLKLLNKSYSDLYAQSIAIKEFLLNKICILRKEIYTNKDRMEHLISSLQDKHKITR